MTKSLLLFAKRNIRAALLCGLIATNAFAQQEAPKPTTAPAQDKKPEAAAPKDEKKPEKPKNIDETVKDFEKISGIFTFYKKVENGKETLYMEVSEAQLNKMYLLQATASTGLSETRGAGIFQGSPLGDYAIEFRRAGEDKLLVVEPNLFYRATTPEMKRTVERGIPPTILFTTDIKARQEDRKSFLIDAAAFFKTDIAEFAGGLGQGPGSLAIDGGFTYIDSLKVFPENAVIRTMYKLNRVGGPNFGGPRAVPFAVSYNLSSLPETSYKPRLSDPRVGYFLVNYEDVTDNSKYDRNVNFIQRWHLEKADPNAPLSPPKKPITFYMDNGIPKEYRDAVRKGLLMYNKAFEKVGIKDAIVVEQMPDDADWDIADVRYNIIRWTEGQPFAIALFRAHPVTGQILNAAINMDGTFATGGAVTWDITVDPTAYFAEPAAHDHDHATAKGKKGLPDHRFCTLQRESQLNLQFGLTAMTLLGLEGLPVDKQKFIKQYVTEVVAHEMGHCLGLRHNFIASTELDVKQLQDPKVVGQKGIGATVMDYSPFNIFALKQKDVDYYAQTIGTYDYWAIQYGYMFTNAETPEAELPMLRKHASQGNLPGNAYRSDGLADAFDPRVSRFDLGKDPLAYVQKNLDVSRYLLRNLDTRLPKNGSSYFEFTRSFNSLLGNYFNAPRFAVRYLGGMQFSDNFKGDTNETMPITLITGAQQRQALALLNQYIFAESAFNLPKKNFAMLAPNPNVSFESSAQARRYPVFDIISNYQQTAMAQVFRSDILSRIVNNEYRSEKPTEVLTLATLFRSTGAEIWSELNTGKEITGLRRNLQRAHIDQMVNIIKSPFYPRDATTLAWDQLKTLKVKINAALPKAKGEYDKAHLEEILMRIDRLMDAETILPD